MPLHLDCELEVDVGDNQLVRLDVGPLVPLGPDATNVPVLVQDCAAAWSFLSAALPLHRPEMLRDPSSCRLEINVDGQAGSLHCDVRLPLLRPGVLRSSSVWELGTSLDPRAEVVQERLGRRAEATSHWHIQNEQVCRETHTIGHGGIAPIRQQHT